MKILKDNLLAIILAVIVVILLMRGCSKNKEIVELEQREGLWKAKTDTLVYRLNSKTQEWEYSKKTYSANEKELLNFLKETNEELAALKKQKGASVGIITKTVTRVDTVVKNIKIPVGGDSTVRRANIVNQHYEANIVSWPDTTSLKIRMWDKVKYSIGKDHRLIATYQNPYVTVEELESFYVTPDKKKKNWKYWVGAIAGGTVVYLLAK